MKNMHVNPSEAAGPIRRWEPPDATGRSNQDRVRHRLGDYFVHSRQREVRAYSREDASFKTFRKFKDMDAFDEWYSPKHHGAPTGVNSQPAFTDVLLDRIDEAPKHITKKEERAIDRKARKFDFEKTADKVFGKKIEGRVPSSANVLVDGKPHGSVAKAFRALGLPMKEHGKFRKELKRVGKLTFKHEKKSYKFETTGG